MDESIHARVDEGKPGHGHLPMILGCGLAVLAVLTIGLVGPGWGLAVVALVLLVCPLLMLDRWQLAEGGR